MNLTHYPTLSISYKDKKWYPLGKLLKIASFSISDNGYPTGINDKVRLLKQISTIIQVDEMEWVIAESYGGLYYRSQQVRDTTQFDIISEVELYVYVPDEIFTFCQLKFGDNLTRLQ